MGTKIEYSINPLSASVDSNTFTDAGVSVWQHYQNKGLTTNNNNHHTDYCGGDIDRPRDPMDKMLGRNNLESIKKTMQIHEDIFKQQVRELHRVYSVQKMLMDDLKKETKEKKLWSPMSNSIGITHPQFIQQQQQQQQHKTEQISYVQGLREDYSLLLGSKERSGSCSGSDTLIKMQRGFDLERAADEAACHGGCDHGEAGPCSKEDMEVDLTLSIGGSSSKVSNSTNNNNNNNNNSKNKKKNKKPCPMLPLGFSLSNNKEVNYEYSSVSSFHSDHRGDCSDPTTPMSSSSVTFDQERKGNHHWLSQGLQL